MTTLMMLLRYRVSGGHVHCRLFTAGAAGQTFEKCGDLVFRVDEWSEVCARLSQSMAVVRESE